MPSTVRQPWCPATIDVHDQHYGTITDKCVLPAGHQGEHRAPRTACDPPGWLVWDDPQPAEGDA